MLVWLNIDGFLWFQFGSNDLPVPTISHSLGFVVTFCDFCHFLGWDHFGGTQRVWALVGQSTQEVRRCPFEQCV